jgi:hypothetical protein
VQSVIATICRIGRDGKEKNEDEEEVELKG